MAQRQRQDKNPFEQGPYIQVAAFCERVLREVDGVVSLIRVIDTVSHTERGIDPPQEMPPFRYPLWMIITLKSGRAKGRHDLTIRGELPSGEALPPTTLTVQLEGEGRGTVLASKMDLEFTIEGLYWFSVDFDGQMITRLPLTVRYARLATGSGTAPPQ